MNDHQTSRSRAGTRGRVLGTLGSAAILIPLVMTPSIANAAPYIPVDAAEAIANGTYLPTFEQEFAAQADAATAFGHARHLAVGIGPRVAGSAAEVEANTYVKDALASYGFITETESFPVSVSTFADATPSRDLPLQVSWQYRPAANALFTGAGAPVTAEVVDVGAGTTIDPAVVAGKFVLVDWNATSATRNAMLTEIAAAGAAGIIIAQTTENSSLANPGTVPAQAAAIQVVGAASGQAIRIRELLTTGPLTLSMTTEQSSLTSTNTIGVRPAVGDADGTAPIVYIGAHIDSVVGSPGASDNASGVGIMLESARIMSQYSLDTEIRVGTWGAEEKGILGSKFHATSLTPEEIARTVGAWNMDMAGTSFLGNPGQPTEFWGLSVNQDNADNAVLNQAAAVSQGTGRGELNRGYVGRSDHQSFHDVGIDAAVFSWMFWSPATSIVLEPTYHKPSDTIDNISEERVGIATELIGGSAFRAALNTVSVTVLDEGGDAADGVPVAMSCGDDAGWREVGTTDADGTVETLAPRTECDFAAVAENGAVGGAVAQAIAGATDVEIALINDTVAPTVAIAADTEVPASGWYRTAPVTVVVTAEDETDAAPTVEVSLDGSTWNPYAAPVALSAEGANTLQARVTDGAGNVIEGAETFNIDTVAPTLAATASTTARGSVTVEAADATSGVASVEYRILPSGAWQAFPSDPILRSAARTGTLPIGAEAVSVELRATDVAGHSSALATLAFAAGEAPVVPEPEPGTPGAPGAKPGSPNSGLATTGGSELLGYGALALVLALGGAGAVLLMRRRAGGAQPTDG
ncbi:M28 family peptidase [Leucobacter rhizosphaerae]|uniref:M28 family peptidase n=1 Tax=Leucobacter rhizosphaerae TaxID=2932245 RepID=A0ABY4FTT3_9MICO|nr:M28 family peptidase [Leucobacter rhizosphaerae]UOQ59678.1 M28 family peptidase [Leucobacter rhizosphaerae]